MRGPNTLPIRRVVHGTDFRRRKWIRPRHSHISPEIENLLAQPTWSVRSLLPPSSEKHNTATASSHEHGTAHTLSADQEITREKLHHLLKLSALPLPKTDEEESKMLKTLRDQVHFVRAIQAVDTTGVEPLITVRDETDEAVEEQTLTLDKMMPYLNLEERVGENGTVRRRDVVRTAEQDREERATWEIDLNDLGEGSQERRRGRYFYVKRTKDGKEK